MITIRQSLIALSASILFSGAAFAAPEVSKEHRTRHMERMAHFLELDASQQERMQAAWKVYGPELRTARREMREQRSILREAAQGDFNDGVVREASARLGEISRESAYLGTRLRHEFNQVLTVEQQEKLAERRNRGQKKGQWRRGSRH